MTLPSILRARAPRPPEEMVGALQDRIHPASGRLRFSKPIKTPMLPDAKNTWIECAKVGDWQGHPKGPFQFTLEIFEQIKRNFEAQSNPIVLTYDHPHYDGTTPVQKAGWIRGFAIEGDKLLAHVELTDCAVNLNKAGSYKFCSVVVKFDSVDRVTREPIGAEIYEIGLTDSPWIDGLKPIQLSRTMRGVRMLMIKEILQSAMADLPDDATLEQLVKYCEGAYLQKDAVEGVVDDAASAEDVAMSATPLADVPPAPDVTPEQAGAEQLAALLTDLSGLDLAGVIAAIQANPDAVKAALGASTDTQAMLSRSTDTELTLLRGTVSKLSKQIDSLNSDLNARRAAEGAAIKATALAAAKVKVGSLVSAGRVLDTDVDKWVSLALEAPAHFDALSASLTPVVPVGTLVTPGEMRASTLATDDESEKSLRASLRLANVKDIDAGVRLHRARLKG